MSTCPKLNEIEATLFKTKTRDDEIKKLKHQTEKHDYENTLKTLKIDNEYYKKKYKSSNKKKMFMIVSEILIGVCGIGVGSTLSITGIAPAGMVADSGLSISSCISTLFTNENFSKLKIRYTKLRDWISGTTLLYQKTLKESIIHKKKR